MIDTSDTSDPTDLASPCCGTSQAARQADACCDPQAKNEALAAGASCCGNPSHPDSTATATTGPDHTGTRSCCAPTAAATPAPAEPARTEGAPVVVIGAGPVGLAAAAHLHERGIPFTVLEAGGSPGAAVREWGHVRLFSPWRYDVDPAARRLLDATGWQHPDPDRLPTGAELAADYLEPLAAVPAIARHLRFGARVTAIARVGLDRVRTAGRDQAPFVVRLADGTDLTARAVVDASGTWRTPNVLGANGLPAHGETTAAAFVAAALPDVLGADRHHHAGRHTVVVGAGHSAATTLLALAELAELKPRTRLTWAVRGGSIDRAVGGGDADALPGRGALGNSLSHLVDSGRIELVTGFAVHTLRPTGEGSVELVAVDGRVLTADRIVNATGYRPDHAIAGELRLDLDPALGCTRALAPLIDPNEHSCGTVRPHGADELAQPDPGYYTVGTKSYGRAPTFLLATGYEQARSVVAALDGDWQAARDVHLDLPETGVCSATLGAKAMLGDAAARFGLAPEIPSQLLSAALLHLPTAGSVAAATRAAAAELALDPAVVTHLAALAGDAFDPTPQPAPEPNLVGAASSGSGTACCG